MSTVPNATDQHLILLRYNNVVIAIHWLTAILVLMQIYIGFIFANMPRNADRLEWFTWHKTIGVTILVLSLVRLGWRLLNPPPPFPDSLPRWERVVATWSHRAFYFLLIALPLSGLATISAGKSGVTTLLGGVPMPLISGIPQDAGGVFRNLHQALVFTTVAILLLHVAAALKHQFIDRARASGRMPPFQSPINEKPQVVDRM